MSDTVVTDLVEVKKENNHEENGVNSNGKTKESKQNGKIDKNKEKRKKKKQRQKNRRNQELLSDVNTDSNAVVKKEEEVEIEYVVADPLEDITANPNFSEFEEIFKKFQSSGQPEQEIVEEEEIKEEEEDDKGDDDLDENGVKKKSKKQLKREKRVSIARLKQLVRRPDVVEAWDVTSHDPALLVFLKGYRNSVIVPRHWNQKRKYLQGKRGVEKPPFQLPDFIAATGISKMRQSIQDKDNAKGAKQKGREKTQPKMHRLEIDYQVLHDAFFKYQTKPKLTIHGDLYYEGKEFELTLKEKRPGVISDDLKRALGMPEGAPPPWLINMQRYGPPPSYPKLRIPGLNAPLPEGARWGYHAGGWGKPPVDEFGRPMYGDVFGTSAPEPPPEISQPIEKNHWGEIEEEEEPVMEEQMEEPGMGEEEPVPPSGFETPSGYETPSAGMQTPDALELRKGGKREEPEENNKQLFQVLQQASQAVGTSVFGSSHKYIIPAGGEKVQTKGKTVDLMKSQKTAGIEISLNANEVENLEKLTEEDFKKKFESAMAEKDTIVREDVSDIIEEHAKKKRKKESKDKDGKSKKYKDFKF